MAAPTKIDVFRVCCQTLDKKSRRTIFSTTFNVLQQLIEVLGYIPKQNDGLSYYVCSFCFVKLNKLSKIDFDLMHKIEALNNEKYEIIKTLREKMNVTFTPVGKTKDQTHHEKSTVADANDERKPECLKRGTIHSPTPRKLKMVKHGTNNFILRFLPTYMYDQI